MKLMKFTLSAPLQSWGEDARWDNRSTSTMPTKSAIIGLLGSCMGAPRGDERLTRMDQQLCLAVRADLPGRVMTDFHTVQGTDGVFLNAEGKPRTGGNTIITPKQYLQGARFTVYLWGTDDMLNACYHAMLHPKWSIYLGRKCCVPAVPVKPVWMEASTPEEAVAYFTEEEKQHSESVVHVEMDAKPSDSLSSGQRLINRRDAVIRADRNEYAVRWIKAFTVSSGGDGPCI